MNTTSRWLSLLGCLAWAVFAVSVEAGPLREFTGYTRPGEPADPAPGAPALEAPAPKVFIGGTVYFSVFDLAEGREGDTWGTGVKDFDTAFVAGKGVGLGASNRLDTSARYLYVYQTINDRKGANTKIAQTTVRLIVEPHLITSWGHFTARKDKDIRGVGFFTTRMVKDQMIRGAVSSDFPAVTDARFGNLAPALVAPEPYTMGPIRIDPTKPAAGDDAPGIEPREVLLLPSADFGNLDQAFSRLGLTQFGADLGYHWPMNNPAPRGPSGRRQLRGLRPAGRFRLAALAGHSGGLR